MKKQGFGSILAGCAIGIATSLLAPMLLPFSMLFIALTAILVVVFAKFGWVAALFTALASTVTVNSVFGAVGTYGMLLVCVLPAAVDCFLLAKKKRYFSRLRWALLAQGVGIGAFFLAAYMLVGQNLADALSQAMYNQVASMPAGFVDYYLAMMGQTTLPTDEINILTGFLTAEERAAMLASAFEVQTLAYKVNLPGLIVNSCIYSGVLTAHWGSDAYARAGGEHEHHSISEWRIGTNVTVIASLLFVTGMVFAFMTQSDYAAPMMFTCNLASSALFTVQGTGVISRMCRRSGWTDGRRRTMVSILFVLNFMGMSVLPLLGFASALWGTKGIITLKRVSKIKEAMKEQNVNLPPIEEDNRDEGEYKL